MRFIPRENGIHMVHVTFDNCHIPGSPFRLLVGHLDADAGKVTAHGDGLKHGRTGELHRHLHIHHMTDYCTTRNTRNVY